MSAVATVKGGLFETVGVSSLTQIQGIGPGRRKVAQILGTKQLRKLRELAVTLNGVAPGSAASATQSRIAASTELGGVRTIETETLVSRNTTADDVTEITADLLTLTTKTTFGASPVANGDGNPLGTR